MFLAYFKKIIPPFEITNWSIYKNFILRNVNEHTLLEQIKTQTRIQ